MRLQTIGYNVKPLNKTVVVLGTGTVAEMRLRKEPEGLAERPDGDFDVFDQARVLYAKYRSRRAVLGAKSIF